MAESKSEARCAFAGCHEKQNAWIHLPDVIEKYYGHKFQPEAAASVLQDMPDEITLPRHVMWEELKRLRAKSEPDRAFMSADEFSGCFHGFPRPQTLSLEEACKFAEAYLRHREGK